MEYTITSEVPSRTELLPPPDGESTGTTDSGRINSAIRQVYNAGGGTVYLEAGIYYIDSSIRLRQGVDIKGASRLFSGTGGVVFQVTADINCLDTFQDDSDYPDENPVTCVTVENILIIPSEGLTTTKNAINAVALRYGVLLKNIIVRNYNVAFYISHSWKLKMDECKASYCNTGVIIKNAGNRITLYDCEFNDNNVGVKLDSGVLRNQNILLLGCILEHNNYGVWMDSTDHLTVQNCYFEGNYLAAVLLRGELGKENRIAIIRGNRFFGNSSGTNGNYGVETRVYTEKYEIVGNSFVGLQNAGIKVTKGILEGFIGINDFRTSNYIEYTGTGYTPIVQNGLSFDFKGTQTRGRAEQNGLTSDRPTDPVLSQVFYDRSIGKAIWWNGSVWKDAMGTNV